MRGRLDGQVPRSDHTRNVGEDTVLARDVSDVLAGESEGAAVLEREPSEDLGEEMRGDVEDMLGAGRALLRLHVAAGQGPQIVRMNHLWPRGRTSPASVWVKHKRRRPSVVSRLWTRLYERSISPRM